MLFHARARVRFLEFLKIGGCDGGFDIEQISQPFRPKPIAKATHGNVVRTTCMLIPNRNEKEFEEGLGGFVIANKNPRGLRQRDKLSN